MTLWELTDKKIEENYKSLLNSLKNGEGAIVSKEYLLNAINKIINNPVKKESFISNIETNLGSLIIDPDTNKILNAFVLYMPTYGGACSSCNEDLIVVYMHEGFKELNPDKCIHMPFIEDIMVRMGNNPDIVEKRLNNNFGILLSTDTREFFCLSCGKWGKITYNSETGLSYE